MGTILLILQLIGAIPSIIKTIMAIIDLIRGLKTDKEKHVAKARLGSIIQRIRDNKKVESDDIADLHSLMCDLEKGECKIP